MPQERPVRAGRAGSLLRAGPGLAAVAVAAVLGLACAPMQRVRLDCGPQGVEIFVDEDALEGYPLWVNLPSDRAHKIMFRGPGYEPVLVVLDPRETEDGSRLDVVELGRESRQYPADELCAQLHFVPIHKELEMQLEDPR